MKNHSFDIKESFLLDGKPFQIISGSIHYFRVVPEYWRDRLEKLKAMGCNTVETYVPWNLHEPKPGEYCYSGMLDLAGFLKLAQELGLWAIVRPSPYICAEWEFGGLPAWLLAQDGMKLRCSYPPYLEAVRRYYKSLCQVLVPLQLDRGGPILMMQVENEYGAYGNDTAYLIAVKDSLLENGVTVPLVTSDGPWGDYLQNGKVPGLLPTANFGSKAEIQFPILRKHTDGPLMCMEFWVGWFDAWGDEAHHTTPAEECAKDLDEILSRGNVNIYMFHGGTNFGFTSGANYYGHLQPDVTSYDYDAPLSESGKITPKYLAMREVIGKYAPLPELSFSTKIEQRAFGSFPVEEKVSLFSVIDEIAPSTESVYPLCMEKLGQNFGYTFYSSQLREGITIEKLQLQNTMDRAQVFLDQKPCLTLYDLELKDDHTLAAKQGTTLEILVENMGRVNYGPLMEAQRKGIDGAVLINGYSHFGWRMYPLPMSEETIQAVDFSKEYKSGTPSFYRFQIPISEPADTFLELPGWGKGCVLLNGFNLGRFWEKGPQTKLYVPAPLLKEGINELIIFETEGKTGETVNFTLES